MFPTSKGLCSPISVGLTGHSGVKKATGSFLGPVIGGFLHGLHDRRAGVRKFAVIGIYENLVVFVPIPIGPMESASDHYFRVKRAIDGTSYAATNQEVERKWQTDQFWAYIRPELEERLSRICLPKILRSCAEYTSQLTVYPTTEGVPWQDLEVAL